MMGYGFGGPFGWLGLGVGMIVHLAFVVLIILAISWLFKAVFSGKSDAAAPASLEILKQRLAKGEITRDEYQQLKQDLA